MLSSVLASTSRGGILALAAGAIVVSCLSRFGVAPNTRRRAAPWWGAALVTATAAMGLMAWFGFDRVTARLQTIPGGTALKERAPLWFDTLALGKDFPLWGTGYGTFPYVEPLVRSRWVESGLVYGHAHNEYLEALVEGGIVRLGLTLVALALVFWFGCRALRRYQGQPVGALALGALFAVSTVAIHSVADFGIHIPAIALLATVISAQLCALGTVSADSHADSDAVRRSSPWTGEYAVRLGGIAPVAGAATAVVLGLVLYNEGGSDNRVQSLIAAWRLQRTGSAGSEERCLRDLEEMVPLAPGNALLQVELGQVHLDVFEQEVQKKQLTQALDAAQAVLAWAPQGSAAGSVHPALSAGPTWQLASAGQEMYLQGVEEQLVQKHLLPGLRHFLQARDLCPLLPEPHVWIAANVDRLQDAEPRGVYLQRSKRLLPTDAKIWFICGVQEIAGGQLDAAWSSWRRSLELSDRFLVPILDTASPLIGPAAILERVVPDQPALLQQAAFHLYPKPEAAAQRRPFLERAVTLLDAAGPLNADQCYLKATLQVALGHGAEALVAYREALALAPGQKEWRYEWAALLYQEGQLQEARKHLLTVLRQQPSHPEARKLYDRVVLELAKKS